MDKLEKVIPIDDKVVIKLKEAASISSGGVILPDIGGERVLEGIVVAVGPGKLLENGSRAKMLCRVGDVVLLPRYGAFDAEIREIEYKVIGERELVAILEREHEVEDINLLNG